MVFLSVAFMQRTYLVTGSAAGTGAATSQLLHAQGHRVIGIDLVSADVIVDLSTPVGRLEAIEKVQEISDGVLDAIITCAGIAAPKPITVATNFYGVTQVVEGLLDLITLSAAPRVVVTTSVAALKDIDDELVRRLLGGRETDALQRAQELAGGENTSSLIFTSSKYALGQWVRHEAVKRQWAMAGIALNAIAPGTILTDSMHKELRNPDRRAFIDSEIPMPLNGHLLPVDVARVLAWFASPENAHITGQTVFVDGGAEAILRSSRSF